MSVLWLLLAACALRGDVYGVPSTDSEEPDPDDTPGDTDGVACEDARTLWWDGDGDGWGRPDAGWSWCGDAPAGWVDNDDDCDDLDASVSPDSAWWPDRDGDGFGDAAAAASTGRCALAGEVGRAGDCDDRPGVGAARHPDAQELPADGIDADCDGLERCWCDRDGDGLGDPAAQVDAADLSCAAAVPRSPVPPCSAATVAPAPGDCDDLDAAVGAAPRLWFVDGDGDGVGAGTGALSCADPGPGWAREGGDCDDAAAGVVTGCPTWYLDADGDGHGDPARSSVAAAPPARHVSSREDCDDSDPAVHPGAAELCDGGDQDCDGASDEGTLVTWFLDADGDGHGASERYALACDPPAPGWVALAGDCDDNQPGRSPSLVEVCNELDDDCDGRVDDGLSVTSWYEDADRDGFGDGAFAATGCGPPVPWWVTDDADCDDLAPAVFPGALEVPGGIDEDCDGEVDDGVVEICISAAYPTAVEGAWSVSRTLDGQAPALAWDGAAFASPMLGFGFASDDGNECVHIQASPGDELRVEGWYVDPETAARVPLMDSYACMIPLVRAFVSVDRGGVAVDLRPGPLELRCHDEVFGVIEVPTRTCTTHPPPLSGETGCWPYGAIWNEDICGQIYDNVDSCSYREQCTTTNGQATCSSDHAGFYGCTSPLTPELRAWLLQEGVPSGLHCAGVPCDAGTPGQLAADAAGPVYRAAGELGAADVAALLAHGDFDCERDPDGVDDALDQDGDCYCPSPVQCNPPGEGSECVDVFPGDCDDHAYGNRPGGEVFTTDLYDNDCDGVID